MGDVISPILINGGFGWDDFFPIDPTGHPSRKGDSPPKQKQRKKWAAHLDMLEADSEFIVTRLVESSLRYVVILGTINIWH